MKLGRLFGHLVESLYTLGAVVVGGTVGAVAVGAAAVAHGAYAAYRWYKNAKEPAYMHALNSLGLLFLQPYGALVSGLAHLYGAYSACKACDG